MLAAEYPSPVGGYLEPVGRVIDVVFGALAQAIPDKAAGRALRHHRRRDDQRHASERPDTTSSASSPIPAATAPPGERRPRQRHAAAVDGELHVARDVRAPLPDPLRALRAARGLRRRRLASRRLRHDLLRSPPWSDCIVSVLGDRADHAPFGVAGGGPAAPNVVELHTGGQTWSPPMRSKDEKQPLQGRRSRVRLAGRRRLRRSADARPRRRRARPQPRLHQPRDRRARLRRRDRRSDEPTAADRATASTPRRAQAKRRQIAAESKSRMQHA